MTSPGNAAGHIEAIQREYGGAARRVQRALAGSLGTVEKAFSRRGHYLYEFLQNADDAGSTRMSVRLRGNTAEIMNDGRPFSPEEVEAVCSVAHSSKKPEGYIGYLGVGFKSVFLASEGPEIHSGAYHFAFRRDSWPEDFPWQVTPLLASQEPVVAPWQTRFVLPLKTDQTAEILRREMAADSLNRRVLLFLARVTHLELRDDDQGHGRFLARQQVGDYVTQGDGREIVYELAETDSGQTIRERWLTVGRSCRVPEGVRADSTTQVWNRREVTTRQGMIAFMLRDDDQLEAVAGTVHMGVFSYLPLREERTGLNFLIQGDFLTAPGRETVIRDAPWNEWLAAEALQLVKDQAHHLLAHPKRRTHALEALWPGSPPYGDSFFDRNLRKPLGSFLQKEVLLPAYDGTWLKSTDALYVSDGESVGLSVQGLVSDDDLYKVYQKKPLAPDIVVPPGMRAGVITEVPPLTRKAEGFLSSREGSQLLTEKAAKGDVEFFARLLQRLDASRGQWTPGTWKSYLGSAPFILTERGGVCSYHKARFRPAALPASLEGSFEFVHPTLSAAGPRRFLEQYCGVLEPAEDEVRGKRAQQIDLPKVREQWQDTDRRQGLLVELKSMWERRDLREQDLAEFVTLPTKSGAWLVPRAVLLPSEFSPEPDVETILRKGLLKLIQGEAPFEFVDPTLATLPTEMEGWKRFLEALGVGERVREARGNWTERIAVEAALRYEENRGRSVDPSKGFGPVPEAERGRGYDIKSGEPEGGFRLMEVKGIAGTKAEHFELKRTTIRQALWGEHRSHFYLYVVTETLGSPRLHIVSARGFNPDRLLNLGDLRLTLKDLDIEEEASVEQLPPRASQEVAL